MNFIEQVKAAYTLKERLQSLRQKYKYKTGDVTTLVGYSVPSDSWLSSIDKAFDILKFHQIKASLPTTKSGHISVCAIPNITEQEREAIQKFAEKESRPQFKPIGLGLLYGQETGTVDYLSIAYAIPDEHKRLFAFIRKLVGHDRVTDYRTWTQDHKPHASLVTVDKNKRKDVEKIIPDIWNAIKGNLHPFKPQFIEFFDKFELSEFYEITQSYVPAKV